MFVIFRLNLLPDNYFKMNLFSNPLEKNVWYVLIGQCAIMHFMSFLFNLMLMYSFQKRKTMPRGDSSNTWISQHIFTWFYTPEEGKQLCPLFFFLIIFFYKAFPEWVAWKHHALLHHNSQCTHSISEWVITCLISSLLYCKLQEGKDHVGLFFFKK